MPSWDSLEPGVHGPRGRRGAAVSVGVFSTRHTRPGQSTEGWAVCAHICPEAVRTRGQECPGAASLALSTLRLTTLAKTQGGASQRPSVLAGPMFVCCCVGQAKVNGATARCVELLQNKTPNRKASSNKQQPPTTPGPTLLRFFYLGTSRRTWSEVRARGFPGARLTPARLSWSQLHGVGVNLESAFGTGGAKPVKNASIVKMALCKIPKTLTRQPERMRARTRKQRPPIGCSRRASSGVTKKPPQ